MGKEINQPLSDEYGKLKGREKLHLPLHSIYQSNLCHNHSACFHTYSVLNKINLSNPVIAFFVRIFKKKKKKGCWNLIPLEARLVHRLSKSLTVVRCGLRVVPHTPSTVNDQQKAGNWMGGAALDPGTEGLAALTWRGTALEPGAEARRVSSVPPARVLRTDRWASHTLCLRRLPTWTEEDNRHT